MQLLVIRGVARASYFNASHGHPGHDHVATSTAGVMLSLFRIYLPSDWKPLLIEFDIPRPRQATMFEDFFSCPVRFDSEPVSISFDAELLNRRAVRGQLLRLRTLEDFARARFQPTSLETLHGVVQAQIWSQVLAGAVSIKSTARALSTSVRSLQRSLGRDGADFREMANVIRCQRGRELLSGTGASITDIAFELGYSTPTNFARAFRKATGMAPHDFRRKAAVGRLSGAP